MELKEQLEQPVILEQQVLQVHQGLQDFQVQLGLLDQLDQLVVLVYKEQVDLRVGQETRGHLVHLDRLVEQELQVQLELPADLEILDLLVL
jgi:hypothetical protein